MIVQEAELQFKLGVDKVDSFNSANFTTEEIDLYISDAQEQFVEQRAYGNNFKRESLEETQKRVKDLQSIITNANITVFINNTNNKPNGFFVELPVDYRHAINETCTLSYTDCNNSTQSTIIPITALTHDQYNTIIENPFSKPSLKQVYRLSYGRFNSKEHFELIIPQNTTLVSYNLRYLKDPSKLDSAQRLTPPGLPASGTLDLADSTYREIIRIAVRNALGDISQNLDDARQKLNEVE